MVAAAFLTATRVLLRPLTEEDCAGPYLEWFNDPEVCGFNGHHYFPYTYSAALAYVREVCASRTDMVLAIVERAGNRHVGNIALQRIDFLSRSAEFSIVIGAKDCWGKGYGKEAARLLLDHGFVTLNLHRISCGTVAENVPMMRLAASLGMQQEGRRRQALYKNNRYLDVVEYGVLRDEYLHLFHQCRESGPQPIMP